MATAHHKSRRRNPEDAAASMYAAFHGKPSEETVEFEEQEHFHENLAGLGVLVELRVRTVTGLDRAFNFECDGEMADAKGNPVWPFGPGQPLGTRTTVKHIDKRSRAVTTTTGSGAYKGYQILKHGDGTFEVPQIDRESRFDTKRDAQRFIDDEVKYARNPKEVSQMSGAEINKALDKLDAQDSKLTREFIDSGRGYERASEIMAQSDPLAERYKALYRQRMQLRSEMERRYGPGTPSRLPKGFGPIKRNPQGPVSSALKFAGDVSGLNYISRQAGKLDKRAGKAIGFKGNPGAYILRGMHRITGSWVTLNTSDDPNTLEQLKPYFERDTLADYYVNTSHSGFANDKRPVWTKIEIVKSKSRKRNPEAISTTTTLLTSNEDGTQLYFVGGDQSLDLDELKFTEKEQDRDSIVIGECFFVSYMTQKDFDSWETIIYQHDLSEETKGPFPILRYDKLNKRLFLDGGSYYIPRPMFETSPGITD